MHIILAFQRQHHLELGGITGLAQVPFLPSYDIHYLLGFSDVRAYRALPKEVYLNQVVRLGGTNAPFGVPTVLLPHHEHLSPSPSTRESGDELEVEIEDTDGKPKEVQDKHELEQQLEDEANVKISVHARLPACFNQELLDFVSALVKATKIVELGKRTGYDG